MPQRAEAGPCWRSFDDARPHVKAFRGKVDGREAIRARLLSFLRKTCRPTIPNGVLGDRKDQLVKRAEARIFWARVSVKHESLPWA
jgi:hypothetical protein